MKIREVLKLLRDDGWLLKRKTGSHHQFCHPRKGGLVTVSVHSMNDDLSPKNQKSILKQAGLQKKK